MSPEDKQVISAEDKQIIAAFKEILERELAGPEGKLAIRGLGVFTRKTSPARTANSFGKKVEIPERSVIRFKAAPSTRRES